MHLGVLSLVLLGAGYGQRLVDLDNLGLDKAVVKQLRKDCKLKKKHVSSMKEMECLAARLEVLERSPKLRGQQSPKPSFADWKQISDPALLGAELAKYDLSPTLLQIPSCDELGYVNIVYNTWSKKQREEIRMRHRKMVQHVNLTHAGGEHDDDVFKWLRRRFSVDANNQPVRISDDEEPGTDTTFLQRKLARVLFPVHPNTNEGGSSLTELKKESSQHADMIVFDGPDSPFIPSGITEGVVLRYFAYCARLQGPRWQWVVRSEPEMVVNTPHLVYFLRSLDSKEVEVNAKNPFGALLSEKPTKRAILNNELYRYIGKPMSKMEVIKRVGHNHYEPMYDGLPDKKGRVYPDYMSGRFFIMDRAMVSVLGFAYNQMVSAKWTVFNREQTDGSGFRPVNNRTIAVLANSDAMLGVLVDDLNRHYLEKPGFLQLTATRGGIETSHRIYTQAELCGSRYFVEQEGEEFSAESRARYAAQYRKGADQRVVAHLADCDCDNWIVYPPVSRTDKDRVYEQLFDRCAFRDRFYDSELEWMQ